MQYLPFLHPRFTPSCTTCNGSLLSRPTSNPKKGKKGIKILVLGLPKIGFKLMIKKKFFEGRCNLVYFVLNYMVLQFAAPLFDTLMSMTITKLSFVSCSSI